MVQFIVFRSSSYSVSLEQKWSYSPPFFSLWHEYIFLSFHSQKKRNSLWLKRIYLLFLSGRLLHPPVFHEKKNECKVHGPQSGSLRTFLLLFLSFFLCFNVRNRDISPPTLSLFFSCLPGESI